MLDWLAVRGEEPGALFWRIRKGERIEAGFGISGDAGAEILERRRREVFVSPLTPHDWRRSFVGDLLDAGADLAIVQQLAGHASPATTARYHMLLIQANPDNGLGAGNVVGWYTVTAGTPGFPGRIALGGNTPLAAGVGGNVPVLMARLGGVLYVGEQSNGEIDSCQVSTAGVSNCRQVATLTGAGTGFSGPWAVF